MNLETLQREMAAAVMQPLTPEENMRAHAADGRAMTAVAESFIAPNSRLSACERLEIYNRQYWYRVLDALIEDFRALRAVVGASAFQALSIAYLTAHPSRSFTMRNLGSKLPEWLAANPQFSGRRHRLAMDVARIEWAFVEAWDGADHTPLTLDQIATLDGGSRLATIWSSPFTTGRSEARARRATCTETVLKTKMAAIPTRLPNCPSSAPGQHGWRLIVSTCRCITGVCSARSF